MSKPIEETERCELFEQIAEAIWNRIIRAHDVNVNLKEVGITADILVDIQQYNKKGIPNFDVYSRPSYDEKTYGSDIDIFVETNSNQYRWFALQAKVLKKNNRYDTLRDSSDGIMQWEKLALLEGVSGCKAYYLLYNGNDRYSTLGIDECRRAFSASQFGCSIVEPITIKKFANKKHPSGNFKNPKFEDIHPSHAQPWRILVCCYHDTNDSILYSMDEILESNPNFKKLDFENLEQMEGEENKIEDIDSRDNNELPIVENNEINAAVREAKWNPTLRIIIKRTDSLNKLK
jgi:hypothetical protein